MDMTTLDQAKALAATGDFDIVPVSCQLYADDVTPIMVLRKLQNVSRHCYLLESVENSTQGRYTFLGYNPTMEIT